MKLIIAYIQPQKLNQVKQLLYDNNIQRFSVVDAFGHSDEASVLENYRGIEMEIDLAKKVRFEIAVNDEFVEPVIKAFLEGGKTGKYGDGKIFVVPLDECYSITTGSSGSKAIG